MNCLVTAGPTYESLDEVRRLTNFSTGQLGSDLAGYLAEHGHEVTVLKGYYALRQEPATVRKVIPFTTTDDLKARLAALASGSVQAVFHVAAVSDFTFGKVWRRSPTGELQEVTAGKFSSREGRLLVELEPTPKIIAHLRSWFPQARLVGWKYEVDGSPAQAVDKARQQLSEFQTDACVINGRAYGAGYGLVTQGANCLHLQDAAALFGALTGWIAV
ncbi:MAG: DNA/pantothenate metabolism flavoprotein domain protein [Chloroflexi bacterium]|nr:DNA/pantothenate metabolism flavoprotein domain protein [Chloroflexota bacterium]